MLKEYRNAFTVTYYYYMKDGVCCDENAGGVRYQFSVVPYKQRRFRTVNNAVRTLKREGFRPIPAYKGPTLVREHFCTGKNPAVRSYPVYAVVS